MNAINWFEIPAEDFERAATFYEKLLQISMRRETFGGTMPNAIFPYEDGVGGAVVKAPYARAAVDGVVVYLNAKNTQILDAALEQVEALGGAVIMPKTDIGAIGYIAMIRDTEGNRVGLHIPAGA